MAGLPESRSAVLSNRQSTIVNESAFRNPPSAMTPWAAHDRPFLDPAVVARLGTLELKARTIVEGFLSGLHRSPFKGFSVEFAEYRQYIPGDDLHTIDWKVYARSDRNDIKKIEEEKK